MIATRESIAEFIKAQVTATLGGITVPELRFSLRSDQQPPEFPNVLNLYFFDDDLAENMKTNPAWRTLGASFELLIGINADNPLVSDKQSLTAIHLINQFMAVQTIQKKDYSVNPAKNMGSGISWRDSYPIAWRSAANEDERYVHRTAFLTFRYFEQKLVVA